MVTLTCQLDNNWNQTNYCSLHRGEIWKQIYRIRLLNYNALNYTAINTVNFTHSQISCSSSQWLPGDLRRNCKYSLPLCLSFARLIVNTECFLFGNRKSGIPTHTHTQKLRKERGLFPTLTCSHTCYFNRGAFHPTPAFWFNTSLCERLCVLLCMRDTASKCTPGAATVLHMNAAN